VRSIKEYALNFYWAILKWVYFHPRTHHRLAPHSATSGAEDRSRSLGDRLAVLSTSSSVNDSEPQYLLLKHLLRGTPFWLRGHLELGEIALSRGEWLLAYGSAQAALQLRPDDPRAFLLRGKCALRTGVTEAAAGDLERAHDLFGECHNSDWADCVRELAAAYMAKGEHVRAGEILDALPAASRDPASAAAQSFAAWKGRQSDAH
jgi:tetratricopeptide (TPR) repeat protein